MIAKRFSAGVLAMLLFAAVARGEDGKLPESAPASPSGDTAARIHWMGLRHLGFDAGGYFIMRLLDLPESKRLQAQTLDKLAAAPWRLVPPPDGTTNVPYALFRPMLNDILFEETSLEIRHPQNQPGEVVFAIHLDAGRAALWETNLAGIMEYLTHIHPTSVAGGGWTVKKHHVPNLIELTRVGDWTLIGIGQDDNKLLHEVAARAARGEAPLPPRGTNYWIEADIDPRPAVTAIRPLLDLPPDLPRFSLSVTGDGAHVLMRGHVSFPEALSLELEPWNVPTDLLQGRLVNFTAARGIAPYIASCSWWTNLHLGVPPNQAFFWTAQGSPLQSYFAAPVSNPTAELDRLSELLLQKGNPWLTAHAVGSFQLLAETNGVVWAGLPMVSPFLKSVATASGGAIFGGLLPPASPAARDDTVDGLVRNIQSQTNLVYYNWEYSGPRMESTLYIAQIARVVARHPQMAMDSAGAAWLHEISLRLDNTTTAISRAGPNQLSFFRSSTVGFTSFELNLLTGWLESPDFPLSLRSLP